MPTPRRRAGNVLTVDWMSTLEEQVEFLAQIAEDVARTLALPDLSDAQALRLYLVVEQGGSTFDRILAEMDEDDVEDDLFEAAADIADILTSLSISTANKLRAMEGLAPIEFPPDDGSSGK
ncbi:hypothetical protein [Phyllobacterium zundukense]|uniref:Uncharacterized protein n=1 Tax=Phyllobacterium zundukense TaxID=1867719 RepID=A0ACD4D0B8_9HYPH|nr:hypothetical protein [Phyllobacterium zundukense]UXN59133.1 hypothetical protein N8E88_09705 [Phyllobacterium zundukense]